MDRLKGRRIDIYRGRTSAGDILANAGEPDGQLICRLREYAQSSARIFAFVDAFRVARGIVDEPPLIVVVAAKADRGAVAKRGVKHAFDRAAQAAVLGGAAFNLDLTGVAGRVGRIGDKLEQPAEAARAVKRSLRPAQNLDPPHIEGVKVGREYGAVGETRYRAVRGLINVGGESGTDAARVDTAKREAAGARLA